MNVASDILYIPPRIANTLNTVTRAPLTLITAGSGFGKTTAVMDLLRRVPRDTVYSWYTCFGEPAERAWEGICRLIAFADARVGAYLSMLELPTASALGQIAALMGEISCEKETILVIDNFQLADFPLPYGLLSALAAHRCRRLHITVLSHALYSDAGFAPSDPRIHSIPQQLLCFSPEDIQKLFSLGGATVTAAQAQRLYATTEGWVAALRLHLSQFLSDGEISENAGIGELVERAFWAKLSEKQKELYLGLSLLDTFTEGQAARMLGRDVIADELWQSARSNAFVRKTGSSYSLHSLLKSFLSAKLAASPEAFQRKMFARAGAACQLQGKNVEALRLFTDSGEEVSALSVPLSSLQLAELIRTSPKRLEALLTRCHTEVLVGRWQLLLGIAVKASLNEKNTLARQALLRLEQLSETGDETNRRRARAALEMAGSFRAYNDIAGMSRHHAAVISLLEDPQDFYVTNDSWSFCVPSVVYMFWREGEALAETAALLRGGIPSYAILGGGKGLGAPETMEAEAMLLSGEVDAGVSQCYLARTVAARAGQDSLLFCVWTQLARAALLRGDAAAFQANLKEIERYAFEGKEFLCVTTSETARGFLYSLLDWDDKVPMWMLSPKLVRDTLYPISAPFAFIVTLRHIRRHRPEELIGTADAFIREADALHHALPKLYFLLEKAVWYEQHGERENARHAAEAALALAVPDGVLLPFAEYYAELSDVLSDARLQYANTEALRRIQTLGRRFEQGAAAIRAALTDTSPLTPREREVALLARGRVSTREIAQMLNISTSTVKNTLNKIYSKLDITGKTELKDKKF